MQALGFICTATWRGGRWHDGEGLSASLRSSQKPEAQSPKPAAASSQQPTANGQQPTANNLLAYLPWQLLVSQSGHAQAQDLRNSTLPGESAAASPRPARQTVQRPVLPMHGQTGYCRAATSGRWAA